MGYRTDHSEMALTLNTKHQYLKYFEDDSKFDHLAAFAPTQRWESLVGYDVGVPFLKTAVYQYKRPKITEGNSVEDGDRQFELEPEQWLTLILLFEPGEAFFALPVVWGNEELPEAVSRTLFVDVYGILPNTTWCYVSEGEVTDGEVRGFVHAKTKETGKYVVHPKYIYGWQRHRENLSGCSLGLTIRDEEDLQFYHESDLPEEQLEAPPTTAEFDEFRSRLDTIGGDGLSDSERRSWARGRLTSILTRQLTNYKNLYGALTYLNRVDQDYLYLRIMTNRLEDSRRWEFSPWDWITDEFQQWEIPDETLPDTWKIPDVNLEYIATVFDSTAAFQLLEDVLDTYEDKDVDPTRHRIRNARHAMLGK
jgi:hypothetical protein